jgi:4a-hydroxytetrahydrobiopterin dehydratase
MAMRRSPVLILLLIGLGTGITLHPAIALEASEILSPAELESAMMELPGWETDGQSLTCTYQFPGFVQSVAFVSQLVEPAERLGHHPDITINYNRVSLVLTTHDAGGLTELDIDLAQQISTIASTAVEGGTCLRSPIP